MKWPRIFYTGQWALFIVWMVAFALFAEYYDRSNTLSVHPGQYVVYCDSHLEFVELDSFATPEIDRISGWIYLQGYTASRERYDVILPYTHTAKDSTMTLYLYKDQQVAVEQDNRLIPNMQSPLLYCVKRYWKPFTVRHD